MLYAAFWKWKVAHLEIHKFWNYPFSNPKDKLGEKAGRHLWESSFLFISYSVDTKYIWNLL